MKKILLLLLTFATCLPPAVLAEECTTQDYLAAAEPKWECPAPGEDALVPRLNIEFGTVALSKGAQATFAGMLVDSNRVIQLGLRVQGLRRLLYIEKRDLQAISKLELEHVQMRLKLENDLTISERDGAKAQLAQAQAALASKSVWYRSWTCGLIVGMSLPVILGTSMYVVLR